jgi:hypothetical protein
MKLINIKKDKFDSFYFTHFIEKNKSLILINRLIVYIKSILKNTYEIKKIIFIFLVCLDQHNNHHN